MRQQFFPTDSLKPYIKCYWVYASDKAVSTEVIYPGGYIELAINLSTANLTTIINEQYIKMPHAEVLGQLTLPARLMITGKITVLVVRFYAHTGSVFFPGAAAEFTNGSIDLTDIFGKAAALFYQQLMEQDSLQQKIEVLDLFFLQRLKASEKKLSKLKLVEGICYHTSEDEAGPNIKNLAIKYGYSERYIQKLFLEFVGLTPKIFYNIRRFNKSLQLVQSSGLPLTNIAYECGYYDQSHFIKSFKAFSGSTPLQFQQSMPETPN